MAMRRVTISIAKQATATAPRGRFQSTPTIAPFVSNRFTSLTCRRFKSTSTTSTTVTTKAAATPKPKPTTTESTSSSTSVPMLHVTAAMIAGIATVAATATLVESTTASSIPQPFILNGERFDQSTFLGRFCKMTLACDPRLLLYTESETRASRSMVENHVELLKNVPDGMTVQQMNHALWEAQRISAASLHPDTGSVIPAPFRMSGYVPFNGPICVAMVASTSTPAILFWSWVNQSQNALVNYFNRNASSEMDNGTLVKSYSIAVASALTVAFGLATAIQKRYSPSKAKELMRWVAFPSAVVASSLNCYIVRSPEITSGIPLVTNSGENVLPGETSQIAAAQGVYSTTASRALLQAPVYFLPPVLMGSIPLLKSYIRTNPKMSVPLTTYLVLVSFGLGLPATVAIFPQMAEIDAGSVEEKFQGLRGKDGLPHEKYYYNKGL